MNPPIRHCLRSMVTSPTLEINEQVREARKRGETILHLGFGEAPFPVHPLIQSALSASTENNHYLPALGLSSLRKKAKDYVIERYRLTQGDYTSIIGPGSKELIFDFQLAIEGDLLFPVPSWVSYIPQTYITGDRVIKMKTRKEQGYRLTPELLKLSISKARTEGYLPTKLILNFPNNPTGMTYHSEDLKGLASVCREENIIVISDEIYGLVDYSGGHVSMGAFYPEGTIITTGLSKHLSLGGFRLGLALVPRALDSLIPVMRSIISETFSSVSSPIQQGVTAAFEKNPLLEGYITECTAIHRDVSLWFVEELNRIGLNYPPTEGAFYLFPDFRDFRDQLIGKHGIHDSRELCSVLLKKYNLACLPGTAFGDESQNLSCRMSTVDYDGEKALNIYRSGDFQDRGDFVKKAAPSMAKAVEVLEDFLS